MAQPESKYKNGGQKAAVSYSQGNYLSPNRTESSAISIMSLKVS